MNKATSIHNYRDAKNDSHVATLLSITEDRLQEVALPKNKDLLYKQHFIKRRNNYKAKSRPVWEVKCTFLNNTYKKFAFRFGEFARDYHLIHESASGYVNKKGTRENAGLHKGHLLLLRADLSNFFPSITSDKLSKVFEDIGLDTNIIKTLVGFLTIDQCLPIGLPSSPMLANIVCKKLDEQINALALKYQCSYTRYADDISISGNMNLPTKKELFDIISAEGFKPHESKFRITKRGQAHYVTGLSISDEKMPHAPRALKKKLRQELYYCNKFGIRNHLSRTNVRGCKIQSRINQLHGMICYISHIEKKPDLLKKWFSLLEHNKCKIIYKTPSSQNYHPCLESTHKLLDQASSQQQADGEAQEPKSIEFYVDETEIKYNEHTPLLAIAFCAIAGDIVKTASKKIQDILEEYIADPNTGSNKNNLKEKKLHFNAADDLLKDKCINYLSKEDFKTYVSYCRYCKTTDKYEESYINLIKKILPQILDKSEYHGRKIIFNFELNNKVKEAVIKGAIKEINDTNQIEVKFVTKSDYCVTIPDFMAGVFNQYIVSVVENKEENDLRKRAFDKLRHKYTSILNVNKNIWYRGTKLF